MKIDPGFVRQYRQRYEADPDAYATLGFDAAALLAARIRDGADTRIALRNGLAAETWYQGVSGLFRFDSLGNRVEKSAGGLQIGVADTQNRQ